MTANIPLNMQAIALEEAETKIREIVKDEFLKQTSAQAIEKKVAATIGDTLNRIRIPALKDAAARSLRRFAARQYRELRRSLGNRVAVVLALAMLTGARTAAAGQRERARSVLVRQGCDKANLYGSALKKFSDDYFRQNVAPVLDRLGKQFAADPDDVSGRNSLRNRAEMEARVQGHLDNIEELKSAGHKLVIASAHADCSERCRPWQGRVYSMDGTRGVTDDGRPFIPLEEATDVYYTTKAGKTYKNGLLGFNCRHYLVPYRSGYRFPKPNPQEEARQYAITLRQRELERQVRTWRIKAIEAKNINREEYLHARRKAIEANERYIAYSRDHRRAYYPSRTKIL